MNGRRRLAIASWIVTVGVSVIALGLFVATRDTSVPTLWGFRGALEILALTWGTVGAIVAIRHPENLNGWLFCALGLFFAAHSLFFEYVVAAVFVVPGDLPFTAGIGWLLTWLWAPPLGLALIFLPLLFPTGGLLSRRWRAVAALGVVAIAVFSAAVAFVPGPIQQAPFLDNPLDVSGMDVATYGRTVVGPAAAPFLSAILLALASQVLRFRRAPGDERLQIKWFALAVVFAGSTFILHTIASLALGSLAATNAIVIVGVVGLMGLPTAAGMAILRYRLYDIDRIVSRTIAYALMTGLLAGVFVGAVLLLQTVLTPLTSGDTIAVAASTLAVLTLFQPVRRRVQAAVDRRFDRARYDGQRMAAAFADRLRDEVDISAVAADLDATVRAAVRPTTIGLWVRGPGG